MLTTFNIIWDLDQCHDAKKKIIFTPACEINCRNNYDYNFVQKSRQET